MVSENKDAPYVVLRVHRKAFCSRKPHIIANDAFSYSVHASRRISRGACARCSFCWTSRLYNNIKIIYLIYSLFRSAVFPSTVSLSIIWSADAVYTVLHTITEYYLCCIIYVYIVYFVVVVSERQRLSSPFYCVTQSWESENHPYVLLFELW